MTGYFAWPLMDDFEWAAGSPAFLTGFRRESVESLTKLAEMVIRR